MNRIDAIFEDLRAGGRKALMPFVTAGYPTLRITEHLLPALERAGASICELGFPFSDPIADGPVIQSSMAEALDAGTHPSGILDTVRQVRPQLSIGSF
ncbi:MAG: tryptophan synthase subunit alpha, partial [Phycisphaerae bacterium]|nr:tryptophan synthase subunit alpha [Phycisphaerae bacterium]